MFRRMMIVLFSIVFLCVVYVHPDKLFAQESDRTKQEIQTFLEEAYQAQLSLNRKARTLDEVNAVLAPYFTEEYTKMFVDARLFKDVDGWFLPGSDDFFAIVPRFTFDDSTEITVAQDKIVVSEFVEANNEGPWTWEAHTESVVLRNTEYGWRISNINNILKDADAISIQLNEETMSLVQSPIIEQNRVFVPLRGIFEHMGASVKWIGEKKTVHIQSGERQIALQIGTQKATVNEEILTMDVAPFIADGYTLVPLRFISETLGMSVAWDARTRTVIIKDN